MLKHLVSETNVDTELQLSFFFCFRNAADTEKRGLLLSLSIISTLPSSIRSAYKRYYVVHPTHHSFSNRLKETNFKRDEVPVRSDLSSGRNRGREQGSAS